LIKTPVTSYGNDLATMHRDVFYVNKTIFFFINSILQRTKQFQYTAQEISTTFLLGKVNGRMYFEGMGLDGSIILKRTLKKSIAWMWDRFI
jgi:hypothetical protein